MITPCPACDLPGSPLSPPCFGKPSSWLYILHQSALACMLTSLQVSPSHPSLVYSYCSLHWSTPIVPYSLVNPYCSFDSVKLFPFIGPLLLFPSLVNPCSSLHSVTTRNTSNTDQEKKEAPQNGMEMKDVDA